MKVLDSPILEFRYNKVKPTVGSLLISQPFSTDNSFKRSVILIVEHNDEGTFGFILNKPVTINLSQMIQGFPWGEVQASLGGPVSNNTIHYLHSYGKRVEDSVEVLPGLFWGGNFEQIKEIVKNDGYSPSELRFFVGYSGWEKDQLFSECNKNYWAVYQADKDRVLATKNPQTWNYYIKRLGDSFKVWINAPEDPGLN